MRFVCTIILYDKSVLRAVLPPETVYWYTLLNLKRKITNTYLAGVPSDVDSVAIDGAPVQYSTVHYSYSTLIPHTHPPLLVFLVVGQVGAREPTES